MSVQLLWLLSLALGVLGIAVILLQLVVGQVLSLSFLKKRTYARLEADGSAEEPSSSSSKSGLLENLLLRANVKLSPRKAAFLAVLAVIGLLMIGMTRGWIEAGAGLFFIVTAAVTWWRVTFERQRRQIFEELPSILDGMIRSISVGRSVEQSVVAAFSDGSPVFDPLIFRLKNAVGQGRDYTRVIDEFAALYQIPDLVQVAIAFRTSSRFGSSLRPVLMEVAKAIRSRQDLRREFMAATAETRFTAVAFAIIPPGLAAYMVILNDGFSAKLLDTNAGQTLLWMSGILQLIGIVFIWRLIQGVGRG